MSYITYNELVNWYGRECANGLVVMLEQAANLTDNVILFDRQERLQRAFNALDQDLAA